MKATAHIKKEINGSSAEYITEKAEDFEPDIFIATKEGKKEGLSLLNRESIIGVMQFGKKAL